MHDDPAYILPALGHLVIDDVYTDGGALLDGNTEGQVGDPDEDVP